MITTSTPGRPHAWPWIVAALVPVVIGLWLAVRGAWVCDDAFITFRYADNLERGLGAVYNAGERVEGYTHFLWLMLLAALHRTGIDLVDLGRNLPLVFHAGTLTLLFVWSWRRRRETTVFLPLAAAAVALHRDLQIWGSGGLETAAFTFCVTAAALAAAATVVRAGLVATLAALAALLRPEGLVLSVCVFGLLGWRRPGARVLLHFALVWLVLVAPLFAWRFVYYQDWLPNTFYAKAATSARWGQGWRYVSSYFAVYPILIVALAAAIIAGWTHRRGTGRVMLACAAVSIVMMLPVVRAGGDFMFARFLVPITPLLYVGLEEALRRRRPRVAILGAVIAIVATALAPLQRTRILADGNRMLGIVDEHKFYPRSFIDERRREGAAIAAIFHDTDIRVCTLGSQASFAYFARFPYVFERYGLTDREFARRPIASRGRPGHERGISRRDLINRRVHFFFRGAAKNRAGALDEAVFGEFLVGVVFYDRALMETLRTRPGVDFIDFPAYLDSIAGAAGDMTPEERRQALIFADGFYFAHNTDAEREARVRAAFWSSAQGDSNAP